MSLEFLNGTGLPVPIVRLSSQKISRRNRSLLLSSVSLYHKKPYEMLLPLVLVLLNKLICLLVNEEVNYKLPQSCLVADLVMK